MPAQKLFTPDVSAEADEDGAEETPSSDLQHMTRDSASPSEFTQNRHFQITFILF